MRVILAAGMVLLSLLSMAAEAAQKCTSIGLTRFALGPGVGSQASVARQTPHGRFMLRAERTGYSSAKMRFALNGRGMAPTSLKQAPPDIKACLAERTRAMSQARNKSKLNCYVMSEPRCDPPGAAHGRCFALACCDVGGAKICGTGTASF